MSSLAQCLSVSPPTTPAVLPLAKVSLPGLALAYSISSLTLFAGMLGWTTSISVKLPSARHGREVLHRVVGDVLHQERRRGVRRVRRHQQRVAVGRGARDIHRRDGAVGAGTGLDDDALLQRHAERLGDHAGDRVAGAAGAERGDDGDRLVRIGLRVGGRDAEQRQAVGQSATTECEATFHAWFLPGCREL